ncbi:hypothetical protein F4774DRAFT_362387 [Daldinia eschscholtzii]|nr:hypothetical protein F4774DRAFT_362387 [Daldinia eschscholtzii]
MIVLLSKSYGTFQRSYEPYRGNLYKSKFLVLSRCLIYNEGRFEYTIYHVAGIAGFNGVNSVRQITKWYRLHASVIVKVGSAGRHFDSSWTLFVNVFHTNRADKIYAVKQPYIDSPAVSLVHTFKDTNSTTGISETSPYAFVVVAALIQGAAMPVLNTTLLWELKLGNGHQQRCPVSSCPKLLSSP